MSFSNMDPNSLGAQQNQMMNPNCQERFVPLSFILDGAIQRTYHQLMIMTDMLQSTSDKERKIKIVAYSCKTRLLFMRIYALVKFLKSAHINVTNILSFLDQQAFIFVDTADFLYHLAKVKLVNARLPSFSISTAVDVLNSGTYQRLPTCIKGRILPTEKIKKKELVSTYSYLNRIIQCRLALSELPYQLKNFKIHKGCALFVVKNEFEIKLTLFNDNFKTPWRLISINFLTKDEQDSNRLMMHSLQKQYIQDIIQQRLNENKRPLVDVYKSLHFIAQSMQLEILFQQMSQLNRMNGDRFYKILEYSNWKRLTVRYWLDYSKNQYDFRFTIFIGENGDFLQTTHYPFLNWRDHKNVDEILKTDELYIEKVINSIIKFRSKKRLMEMQTFLSKIKFCQCVLIEQKPAIRIQFFDSQLQKESIWISIDYYTGLFRCLIQNSSSDEFQLKNSFEDCLNSDLKNLEGLLQKIRIFLITKQLKLLAVHSGFKSYENLSIIHFTDNDVANEFSKIEKNRLFVELNRHDNYLIMITFRTKEDLNGSEEIDWYDNVELIENENNVKQNIFLLHFEKCKFDGENDPTKPFLKLKTITRFNEIITNTEVIQTKRKRKTVLKDPFNRSHLFIKSLIKPTTNEEYLIYNRNIITSLIDKVFYIEESLPFFNFTHILNKQQIVTQNYKKNPLILNMNTLNILSEPKLDTTQSSLRKDSAEFWNLLISCSIRQKQFKDYFLSAFPVTYFYKNSSFNFTSKFNFSLEMNFNNKNSQFSNHTFKKDGNRCDISIFNIAIELKNLDNFYDTIKHEWFAMCQIFKLIKELNEAIVKYPEIIKKIDIKCINFQKLIVYYGPKFLYTIQFEWLKEAKTYDIIMGVNYNQKSSGLNNKTSIELGLTNPHNLFINDAKKYFRKHQSVLNLIQTLNSTFTFAYALNKLVNIPKLNAKVTINQSCASFSSFMFIVYALNHVRLMFHSKYWVDIQLKQNGQITLRDSCFDNIDPKKETEQFTLLKFLTDFFKLFTTSPEETLKNEYFFEIEKNIMSPNSILEIENIVSVLQNEFQNGGVQQQFNINSVDDPANGFAFNSIKSENDDFIKINSLEDNGIKFENSEKTFEGVDIKNNQDPPYKNNFDGDQVNKEINFNNNYNQNNFNTNQYDNFNFNENLNSIDKIEMDEIPKNNGNAMMDCKEKDLLANIDDNKNFMNNNTNNHQWDDNNKIDNGKPQQQPAFMSNFDSNTVINDENIDFETSANGNNNGINNNI